MRSVFLSLVAAASMAAVSAGAVLAAPTTAASISQAAAQTGGVELIYHRHWHRPPGHRRHHRDWRRPGIHPRLRCYYDYFGRRICERVYW